MKAAALTIKRTWVEMKERGRERERKERESKKLKGVTENTFIHFVSDRSSSEDFQSQTRCFYVLSEIRLLNITADRVPKKQQKSYFYLLIQVWSHKRENSPLSYFIPPSYLI